MKSTLGQESIAVAVVPGTGLGMAILNGHMQAVTYLAGGVIAGGLGLIMHVMESKAND